MENRTLDLRQLRRAIARDDVREVILEADDTGVEIIIEDRQGGSATLIAVNQHRPRRYGNPLKALKFLDKIGIHEARMVLAGRNTRAA
jgi:hypothetical protein